MLLPNPFARRSRPPVPALLPAPAPRATPRPVFHPTPLQRSFFQGISTGQDPDSVLKALHISTMTWYRWRQNSAFRAWLSAAYLHDLITGGWDLLSIARKRAETSFPYWKALADITFNPATRESLALWAEWCGAEGPLPQDLPENGDPNPQ